MSKYQFMKTNMHFDASGRIFSNAKALRNRQTFVEKLLWSRLRNKQPGYHFRRQHPLSKYIVDFYCHELLLVIGVDGSVHADPTVALEDNSKAESLKSYGLHILRFTNDEIQKDIDLVVQLIKDKISLIENKDPL